MGSMVVCLQTSRLGIRSVYIPSNPIEIFLTTFNYKVRDCLVICGSFYLASLWSTEPVSPMVGTDSYILVLFKRPKCTLLGGCACLLGLH